jgi:hypothetical protein
MNPTRSNHRYGFLFLVFAGSLILCLACGKKGPPEPPKALISPAVKDLKAEVIKDKVRLTWSIPKKENELFPGLKLFRVYKFESHSSEEVCDGCPVPFEHLLDIRLKEPEAAQVEGDRVIFYDEVQADSRYAYKVGILHQSGGMSEDSNMVQFVTEP